MTQRQNMIGPAIRRLRYQKEWTQAILAARCALAGWNISENTIAKIESQVRCVTDQEIFFLSKAMESPIQKFFQ